MTWQTLIIIAAVLATLRGVLTKKITKFIKPIESLLFFYSMALITTIVVAFMVFNENPFVGGLELWLARGFGMIFGIGILARFESIERNFTKTMIFSSYKDLFSIILSVIFLGEIALFNPATFGGVAAILGMIAFIGSIYLGTKKQNNSNGTDNGFLFWILAHIVIIGIASFFIKLFVTGMPPIVLLANQYLGSIIVIGLIVFFKKVNLNVDKRGIGISLFNGIVTSATLTLTYLAIAAGPVSLITPVSNSLRLLLTVPVGLFLFKERKSFTKADITSLSVAIIGVVLLLIRSFL